MDAVLASTIDILEDVVKLPDWQQELAFTEPRHTELINGLQSIDGTWRLKERVKTVSVALVLCLNVGVDPPDVVKIEPAAHLECWFDPLSEEPQKAIEYISVQLEKQYEQWHSRARYKKCLDPTVDEVKRLCTSLRRYSKEDRVLFHYNGHGVPRPTQNGEIWVFNEKYTQYIPLAIYDLQQWMGAPSIYVFDCSCAGSIVDSFLEFAKQHKKDHELELAQYNAHQQRLLEANLAATGAANNVANTSSNQQSRINTTANNNTTNTTTTQLSQQQSANIQNNNNNNNNNNSNNNDNNKAIAATGQDVLDSAPSKQAVPTVNGLTGLAATTTTVEPSTTSDIRTAPVKPPNYESCFHLAACEAHQILPMQPDLPADLFTSCLTTPIKMALRWFIQKNDSGLLPKVTLDLVDKIPGSLSDRRTMLGELNWIFTAITDTIAWDVLPRDLFQRLYRQDLLVASLFRNFLLADRIMRTYDCTPVSHPRLPKTYHHPMWRAWDMVVDLCLPQLVDVLEDRAPFRTSTFFAEQLTAFEVWLDMDHSSEQQPNHQLLPIILQVLLSPVHRLRALDLLSRFLNLGPGAVNSALSVGIFPYVLKLLQSNAREVRPFLLSIWAKILAIDRRCQVDLVRDHYHRYFLTILSDGSYDAHYRTMAAFVLTCIVRDYPIGQEVAYQANLIAFCLEQLDDPDPMLKKWLAICLGCSWDNYEDARWCGVRSCAHEKLYTILDDPDPEVRAASVYALGTFINSSNERTDHANTIDHSIGMKLVTSNLYDSSILVRHELVVALQYLVLAFESQFIKLEQAAKEEEERKQNLVDAEVTLGGTPPSMSGGLGHKSAHSSSGFLSPTNHIYRSASKTITRSHEINHSYHLQHHQQQQPNQYHHHHHHHQSGPLTAGHNHIPRVNSLNAIPLLFGASSKIVSNVYHVIWKAMYALASDPHPRVSSAGQIIIDEIRSRSYQGMSTESLKESKSNSSISEASSPNTATFSISESPPSITTTTTTTIAGARKNLAGEVSATAGTLINAVTSAFTGHSPSSTSSNNNQHQHHYHHHHQQQQQQQQQHNHHRLNHQEPHKQTTICDTTTTTAATAATTTGGGGNSGALIVSKPQQVPSTNIERVTKSANVAILHNSHLTRTKHRYASSRDHHASEDDNKSNLSSQRPLISTELVDWCTKYFVDPDNNFTSPCGTSGKEDQQREWRMLRVMSYKNVCLRELMIIDPSRFNETISNYKIQQVPNLVTVHPYDPIMIVAGRDEFSVLHSNGPHVNNYDYNSGLAPSISFSGLAAGQHYSGTNLVGGSGGGGGGGGGVGGAGSNNHHHHHLLGNLHYNNQASNGIGLNGLGLSTGNNSGASLDNHHNYHNHHNHHHQNGSHDLIGTQRNCHTITSQITSLQLINAQYNSLVSIGSSDGSVRIWRAYNGIDYSFNPQLVTAFHLMPELQPAHKQGLGMILQWDQAQGRFYATSDQNDVRIIKVWDAASESKVQDIPTCAEYGVSCLSSDGEHSIAAGFLDGSIRIYDTRLKKTDCRTFTFRKHSEKILTLHMFKPGEKHINLVSGDSGGEVRFWDKRAPTSVKRVDVGQKMSVMSVHPNADVFACGLKSGHGIKIYNLDGTSRAGCVIKCQENNSFFNSRHNPSVSCLAFHPLMTSLVAGYSDAVISIYSSRIVP